MKRYVLYYKNHILKNKEEEIIEEKPLFVQINGQKKVLFRTPGDDLSLLAGMCFTEGFIAKKEDIICIDIVENHAKMDIKMSPSKNYINEEDFYQIELKKATNMDDIEVTINAKQLLRCMEVMESQQILRKKTKASHAAMIFSYNLRPIYMAEDVGRHNALDKVIGKALLKNQLDKVFLATLSSRISFEMAKKAAMAGIKILMGISRPTSMAIRLGEKAGMSIITLAKNGGIIIFSGKERIQL